MNRTGSGAQLGATGAAGLAADPVGSEVAGRWSARVAPGADPPAAQAALANVVARYREPHRHYHTFRHVLDVLGTLDELVADPSTPRVGADDRAALEAAAWLHDVVYDPARHDNEAQSARYATELLGDLGVARATVDEVVRLIELTAGHTVDDSDENGMLLADADLAILGAGPDRYERYTHQIRAEYAAVPDDAYRAGRAAVLESFATRPQLYRTAAGRERFEDLARENLRAELAALRAASSDAAASEVTEGGADGG